MARQNRQAKLKVVIVRPGYTKAQNSLFSTKEFIEASRRFVCIRIETFENKKSEYLVQKVRAGKFASEKTDARWRRKIKGAKDTPSNMVVRSSKFGWDGKLLAQLPLDADATAIKSSLLAANTKFTRVEQRKHSKEHFREGRRLGIALENEIARRGSGSPDIKTRKPRRRSR